MKSELVLSDRKTPTESKVVEQREIEVSDSKTEDETVTDKTSEEDEEEKENGGLAILKGSRWSKTIRTLTLAGCIITVCIQLNQCYGKLRTPPVTTHTRFHVNNSLWYPALTVCREPPFRAEVLLKYGLGASPRYTSEWRNFPWGKVTLDQLYTEATYPATEVLLLYGLNGEPKNVDITSSFYFESGSCHTLTPKASTDEAGLDVGYSILMSHSGVTEEAAALANGLSYGWHIFVHEASEKWTEQKMQTYGRQEALFVEVGEEVHLRLSVQEFLQTSVGHNRRCMEGVEHGEVRCSERCRWEKIAVAEGCSVPWFPGIGLPECDTYNETSRIIIDYLRYDGCDSECCGCRPSCRMVKYEALPIIRKPFPEPMSQIYVFFNSRMVTLLEEKPAYDWSTFIAEMGGNLGFLLGLSVLGVIKILERSVGFVTSRIPSRRCRA